MNTRSPLPGPWWAEPVAGGPRLCSVCGRELEPRDRVTLDGRADQLCDDCSRAREFDQTLWEQDLEDPDAGLW